MKNILFFFVLLFSLSSHAQSKPFVPLEYEYPSAILKTPKTYVYQRASGSELRYKDISRRDKQGAVIIIWKEYDTTPLRDSAIEVNDKTIGDYFIISGHTFPEHIIEDSTYRNGSRLGEKVQSGSYNISPTLTMIFKARSHFLKDTTVTWDRKKVPCIVVESIQKQEMKDPQGQRESTSRVLFYFGKDVGLLRFSSDENGETSLWVLKEIKSSSPGAFNLFL